jgi:hypothetical protein
MAGRFGTLIAAVAFGVVGIARGATFTIDDTADLVDQAPGDGVCATVAATCTLRAAIQEANALPGADHIDVSNDLVGNVTLTIPGAGEDAAATGDLDITEDVTIDGIRTDGSARFTMGVDGNGLDRVFHVLPGVAAQVTNFVIVGGATGPGENGGGILNEGTLQGYVLVQNCSAGGDGGGLYNSGTATVGARYRSNTAAGRGGGIANVGTLLLERDLYSASVANNAAPSGGGIYNAGTLTTNAISVMENYATGGAGGGLLNDSGATANLANMTIGANTATSGGEGVENLGAVDLRYVTVNAHALLGLRNDDAGGATSSVHATVLGDACAGAVTSLGYNLTAGCALAGAAASDQIGVDPDLDSQAACAARYVSDTCPHYRPHRGSPVIDAGDPADCNDAFGAPLVADQAGVLRPTGTRCDVGAIESTPVCVGGAPAQKAKLVLSGLGSGSGRQKLTFSGRILDSNIPRLSFFGAQLAVEDLGSGAALFDRSADSGGSLPGGGSIPFSCHMWKRSSAGYSYREIDHDCPFPPVGGVVKSLRVRDRSAAGGPPTPYIDVKFTVIKTTFDAPTGPLRMSFTYGWFPHFSNGVCAETTFAQTTCAATGSHVKCLALF